MGDRFKVEGETCFVSLLTERNGQKIGLILHGERALEAYIQEAIEAYETLLRNKGKGKRIERILSCSEEEGPTARR